MKKDKGGSWGKECLNEFRKIDVNFKKIWSDLVDEDRKANGDDFDISDVYPPKPSEVEFHTPDAACKNIVDSVQKKSNVSLPSIFKEFLCEFGSFAIYDAFGNNFFHLWSLDQIDSKWNGGNNVFIDRFNEPGYEELKYQIPLLSRGIVFATSNLRGADELDYYFFASESINHKAKIYRVEIKEGVVEFEGDFKDFLREMAKEVDYDDIAY